MFENKLKIYLIFDMCFQPIFNLGKITRKYDEIYTYYLLYVMNFKNYFRENGTEI